MSPFDKNSAIGLIGMGRMGRSLVQGLLTAGLVPKDRVYFTTKHDDTGARASETIGISRCDGNRDLVEKSDTIVLAVKPQNITEVLDQMGAVGPGKTVISIVASVTTSEIEAKLGAQTAVIRAMPNTPALVQAGMTAICMGRAAKDVDLRRAEAIFHLVGRVALVDEKHMDAVTGLSGCGPAYIYVVIESLTEGGIKMGLPRDLASELAAQTVLGAAKMLLETGRHPAALKDEVTTPAGCTIDGLLELEEGKLRITLIKAVVKASERAHRLSHT